MWPYPERERSSCKVGLEAPRFAPARSRLTPGRSDKNSFEARHVLTVKALARRQPLPRPFRALLALHPGIHRKQIDRIVRELFALRICPRVPNDFIREAEDPDVSVERVTARQSVRDAEESRSDTAGALSTPAHQVNGMATRAGVGRRSPCRARSVALLAPRRAQCREDLELQKLPAQVECRAHEGR